MMLSDGSGLVFTIREFLSPSGRSMAKGVTSHNYHNDGSNYLDLSKIRYDIKSQKWEIRNDFTDNSVGFN